ncbi:MAG: response regulator [Paracoccaceae bacterium]
MNDHDPFSAPHRFPTPTRPLLGLTVLVVEDSRYASEAMRLLCLRSGARIRRADCLKSARRHLQIYRPSVLVADLGLPDGSGETLIAELAQTQPRVPVILGISGDEFAEDIAIAAGADGFLAKPVTSLDVFQQMILARLPQASRPAMLRPCSDEVVTPDAMAFQDDMAHIADILNAAENEAVLDYVAQFLRGVARSAGDTSLAQAAEGLATCRASGTPVAPQAARLAGLVQDRLQRRQAI